MAARPRSAVVPSGEQFALAFADHSATVVEVGGGVRAYSVGGCDVLEPYPLEAICDGAHGTPLMPWPNRLDGGRYSFDGERFQLPLTEPERGNAIHGLLRWRAWRAIERTPERVVMGIRLHPMPGYPFALDVRVAYELDGRELLVNTEVVNIGTRACPFGAGQHPYLAAGRTSLDNCELQVTATSRIVTDDERKLPVRREPVAGGAYDFGSLRSIGDLEIDLAYADLERDSNGRAWTRLLSPDGAVRELWVDDGYRYIEIYTGDTLAPARRRRGLAAEPMSCAPNAFISGEDLVRLEPGESFSAGWGVRLR
jgi:aldose 1-epimerase